MLLFYHATRASAQEREGEPQARNCAAHMLRQMSANHSRGRLGYPHFVLAAAGTHADSLRDCSLIDRVNYHGVVPPHAVVSVTVENSLSDD